MTAGPLLIAIAYLVLVTLVGLLASGRARTAREWSVAGGGLGALLIAVGVAGTRIGGAATYGVAGDVITGGVWNLWWYGIATFVSLALLGVGFARHYRRLGIETVGEVFWLRFGSRRCQVLTSVCVQTLYMVVNVIEPYIIGVILRALTGMPLWLAIAVATVVLVSYPALGGLWSAAVTNVVHAVVILAGFAGVALAGVVQAGGWDALRAAVDVRLAEAGRDAAAWWSPTGADWVPIIGMLFAAAIHTPAASVYVNFASAARSSRVLVPGFLLAAVLAGIMPMLAGLIGVQTVARFGLASGLTGYRNITAVAVDISPWLGGLAIAAVLAAVISSGGPVLLSSATMWVRDCMPGSRDWTSDRRLRAYRLTTLVFGVAGAMLAWVAAVRGVSLLTLLLAGFAMVVPPGIALTFLLYWRRTTERAAFWGMATGFGAGLAWFAGPYQATGIDPSYPTTIVPLVVMPLLSLAGRGEDDRAAAFFARLRGDDS